MERIQSFYHARGLPDRLKACLIIVFVSLFFACSKKKEIIAGTSLELALERKETISNLQYALFLDIPSLQKDSIKASVTIRFDLKNSADLLQLDFNAPTKNIKNVIVNKVPVGVVHENEHILIDKRYLINGANAINIEFIAGEAALNRNADYLYTLFVPSRANTCFPIFDQPDLKAVYHLELSIPKDWQAVSNGKITSIDSSGNKKLLSFSDTKPTSTYQFAFAAGKFHVASDPESGITFYYRETDSVKVARNLAKIFELHRKSLDWLRDYTGISYPYEKFDFALIPSFQFGGMEHPGNIFYRESSLFLDPSASVNDELRRAGLIAHETAHMWFGNLVTMKWFNDVWLKEVFANFMAAKIVDPSFPQINHSLRFLMGHYPAAYDIDRSAGTHPIQQELDNLKNAGSVYGAIIYQKAPIMMRNLESLMGQENFQKGLQQYLSTYSYQNATWDDLVNIMTQHSDQDLGLWNQAWIKTKGMPELEHVPSTDKTKLEVHVVNDPQGVVWPQYFYAEFHDQGKEYERRIEIKKGVPVSLDVMDASGFWFIPNYKGRGYGYFKSDQTNMMRMLSVVSTLNDPEARAGVWLNVWEYLLRGELDPQIALQNLMTSIQKEKDPLLLEYVTDKIGRIFWQFLTPAQRKLVSNQLDETLFEQLLLEHDNSLKRLIFYCYRNVAVSKAGMLNLKKFWKGEITAGLDFSERDQIQLAYELAVREVEGHEAILKEQLDKIKNPDRKAEVQFIIPSLSPDSNVRDEFFESLKRKENRTHEPWVLEAQRYLNHPLRSDHSVKYVKSSLTMLEEMQKTGDIFFPKGWLDATLGEYQSEEAASAVRGYLKENSGLRSDLKNKLLQSTDMLFRAEQVIKKNKMIDRR